MEIDRVIFRRWISFSFFGDDVDQSRLFGFCVSDIPEYIDEMVQIVSIDGSVILKIKRFKQHAWSDKGFQGVFGPFGKLIDIVPKSGYRFEEFSELSFEILQVRL